MKKNKKLTLKWLFNTNHIHIFRYIFVKLLWNQKSWWQLKPDSVLWWYLQCRSIWFIVYVWFLYIYIWGIIYRLHSIYVEFPTTTRVYHATCCLCALWYNGVRSFVFSQVVYLSSSQLKSRNAEMVRFFNVFVFRNKNNIPLTPNKFLQLPQ